MATGRVDGGFTLVDMLLAVAILGIAVVTLVGGMMTAIRTSDLERKAAEALVTTRAYAEAVANDTYADCAASYPAGGASLPAGMSIALAVRYWDATSTSFVTSCPATDSGLQRVIVTVSTSDGRATESIKVAKRRRPAGEP